MGLEESLGCYKEILLNAPKSKWETRQVGERTAGNRKNGVDEEEMGE